MSEVPLYPRPTLVLGGGADPYGRGTPVEDTAGVTRIHGRALSQGPA